MNNHIYSKKITCPICNSEFETLVVKVNSPRIAGKDSDFFIRYNVINPYFYDVWLCNSCGYSAMKADFPRVKSYHKEKVLQGITRKWRPKEYPEDLDVNHAIERYKLALINSVVMEKPNSSHGMICLKIAWMYRLLNNESEEINFLKQALKALTEAYIYEDFPMYGLQRDSMTYLIGELNRRVSNNTEAMQWYSKTITTAGFSQKVKELARDGRDKIKESK